MNAAAASAAAARSGVVRRCVTRGRAGTTWRVSLIGNTFLKEKISDDRSVAFFRQEI
jgi:hypothetical protein